MLNQIEVIPCATPYVLEYGYQRFGRTSWPFFSVGINRIIWPNYMADVMWINKLEDGGLFHQGPRMLTANISQPVPAWEYQ